MISRLAQLVERETVNLEAIGSIPIPGVLDSFCVFSSCVIFCPVCYRSSPNSDVGRAFWAACSGMMIELEYFVYT